MLKDFYLREEEKASHQHAAAQTAVRRLAFLRAGVFFLAVLLAALGYDGGTAGYGGAALLLALFALLVRRHRRAAEALLLSDAKLAVLAQSLARFSTKWRELSEDGTRYFEKKDGAGKACPPPTPFTDLSVYGPSSLYQYLCRARTRAGRERLAAAFRTDVPTGAALAQIEARQAAIKELLTAPEQTLALAAYGALLPEGSDLRPLAAALAREPRPLRLLPLAVLLPAALLVSLVLAARGVCSLFVPGGLFAAGFLLAWSTARGTESRLSLLAPLAADLAPYAQSFAQLEQADVKSPLLREMQATLRGTLPKDAAPSFAAGAEHAHTASAAQSRIKHTPPPSDASAAEKTTLPPASGKEAAAPVSAPPPSSVPASRRLRTLARLAALASWRQNFFFYALANGLCLFDVWLARAFLRWQRENRDALPRYQAAWAELEVLLSLATLPATRAHVAYPTFCPADAAGAPFFRAASLTNPLLPEARAVANDADLPASTTILTGSNMSGKTTYLRTIGMNYLLALTGAPVCAASLRLTPLTLYTSIHALDDLAAGVSTFYAELLRIKQMVEAEKTGAPLLLLIDEIFKGTNSADRITGAAAALRRLTNAHTIALVSTHDFALCRLDAPSGTVRNQHFDESYEGDSIHFDYQIKDGPCTTTNAAYLLRMVGITE